MPLARPDPGCVHVWTASVTALRTRTHEFWAILSEDERARADRYRLEPDRARFTVGRGVLRELLGRYAGRGGERIVIRQVAAGKPFAPEAMRFNVSHSGDFVLLAFAAERDVGIDVEEVRPSVEPLDLATEFFSAAELAALAALDGDERMLAFFRCWTRKEAYLKGTGSGLSRPLHEFDVSLDVGCTSALRRVAWDSSEVGRWQLRDLEVPPGYAAAIAIKGGGAKLHQLTVPSSPFAA
jgi:4'-phosphopantetheinyl transferase